jgi:hypothetical protein
MKLQADNGVKYSSDFFDEDIIELLFQPPTETDELTGTGDFAVQPDADAIDEETAFAMAWDEISNDPELAEALKQSGYSKEKGLSDFHAGLSKNVPASMQKQLTHNLKVDYKVVTENDAFVHYVDGEVALEIPLGLDAAPMASNNGEVALNVIFIVIDCLSIAAAIASINVHVNKSRIAKSLKNPLKKFIVKLVNTKNVRELERLSKAGESWLVLQKILSTLRGTVSLRTVVTTFFTSMSKIEKAIAVAQLLASLILMIATAGVSYAAKLAQLGAAVAMLLADVAAFVISVRK